MYHKVSALIVFLCMASSIHAVSPFQTYSVADGMPNSTTKAIYQDSIGYMWFGTRNGLCRFDGYNFQTYLYEGFKDNNSVSKNDITCFTKNKDGLLWIGSFNWIALFDTYTGKFIDLDLDYPEDNFPQGVVTNIWIDESEHVWISSKTGLYVIKEKRVQSIESLQGAYINTMCAIDKSHLLVEIMGKGVALYNTRDNILEYIDEGENDRRPLIYKMYVDTEKTVWLSADVNHIYQFQPTTKEIIPVNIVTPHKFDNDQIHDIVEYNDSVLVFGTDNGTFAINKFSKIYLSDISTNLNTDLFVNHRIMCMFKDKQDALWLGTFNKGVKYINPRHSFFSFHNLNLNNTSMGGIVGNLIEDNGLLWIGHERGLSTLNLSTGEISHIDILSQLPTSNKKVEVYFQYQPHPHQIYFYLLNRGIYLFDTQTKSIIKRIDTPANSQVRSMTKDINGRLWIAEEELSVYDPIIEKTNSFLSTNINNVTSLMLTQDLLLKHNGHMLVGTRTNGVWEYPYDEQNKYKYATAHQLNIEELKYKNINIIFEDSRHHLWLGTYNSGLYYYKPKTKELIIYNIDNGLAHNMVCDIIEDDSNEEVWVSTVNGVSRICPESSKIVNYTNKMGFPLEEVSRKTFLRASNGLFYVGGNNGIASFDPLTLKHNLSANQAVISSVESLNPKKNGNEYKFDNPADLLNISLPYQNSSLKISFSSLSYYAPYGFNYNFKLEGVDSDWITTDKNEVVYTNLNEGRYTFHIRSSDSEGNWSKKITTLKIIIHPPFWRTIWAKIFYIILFFSMMYLVLLYFYQRKTAKYKLHINQIEKDNIENYYKMKLELFTEFSHELRTPLTLIKGPIEDMIKDNNLPDKYNYHANLIYKNAQRLLLLVNQLMDVRKMDHGSMYLSLSQIDINSFLVEQIDNFKELVKKKHINLLYQNQYWGKDIWFDSDFMEKVIFNLLANAIKFSKNNSDIIITSKEKDNGLVVSVRDFGEGISKENHEKIFNPFFQVTQGKHEDMEGSGMGLCLSKYIINLHKGKIWVESALGEGSEFFIYMPFGIDHFDTQMSEFVESFYPSKEKNNEETTEIESMSLEQINSKEKAWVLIAEDDYDLRKYIVSQFVNQYLVIEATNGEEALRIAVDKIPDIIISDVMMPQMNGIELCNRIKENPNTAHIPVILLTAKIMMEDIKEGFNALADDYITKPFDANLLKIRVQNLIENRNILRKIFNDSLKIPSTSSKEIASADPFIEKLFEIVMDNIDDSDLSINFLAAELGVSRAQLFRKVKAVSDLSPNNLILNIRMKAAIELLESKAYTISEVAYNVGFTDPSYFSKIFKTTFKITPTSYLRSQTEHET